VAGTVLNRHVEPGDTVQPGKILLLIAPLGETELTTQIDEKNIGLLALGQSAQVSADAYPQDRFSALVNSIAPSVDALRGSIEVRLRVPEAPAYLKHEMTVSIDIETGRKASATQIPADSLRDTASAKPWVMVVRDGKTLRQPVSLGLRGSGRVEILDGLTPDDIVLPASTSLPEGRRVRATVDTK
jgi:HlyD family secretion protein